MKARNPTRSFAGALLDFPGQLLLIAALGGALGGAVILALDYAPILLAVLAALPNAIGGA